MARYVDGYVIPIKKNKMKAYAKMATMGRKIWMKYGALDYYECEAAALDIPYGKSFSQVYKLKADETLIFAFVVYKSKAHRDKVTMKVHKDPMMSGGPDFVMPFDVKRFSVGEFKTIVHT